MRRDSFERVSGSKAFSPAGVRAMSGGHKIVYTITDEAPMLATYAFLPIIKRCACSSVPLASTPVAVLSAGCSAGHVIRRAM